jgi:transcriptional regulator with XRE-family HTH domain
MHFGNFVVAGRVEEIDRLVGQNIRTLRAARGVSQAALGEAAGVTFQQIQKYENGSNRISSSRLAKIAAALDTPIVSFFDISAKAADGPVVGPMVTDLLVTPHAVRMLRAFAKLPNDALRRSITAFTEAIANGRA